MKKRWIFAAVLAISVCAVACREQEESIVPKTTVPKNEVPVTPPTESPNVVQPGKVAPNTDAPLEGSGTPR
jgi:hypothetical protein